MSNQSIKYGILLTKEQLDFLKDDRQGFHRMTAFDTFVSMASTKPSVYQKTGFSASLSIGQFAISTVELSALWKCDRKTAAKVVELFNQVGILSTERNNRTSIHTILCIAFWYVDGIKAEELNVLIGSDAVEEEDVKEAVKLNTLILLNQKYGITERDFTRAEIEVVPAAKARDVGFDRSMIGAYGHDDRVDAYPALLAEIETKDPVHTTICVLTDKEEIGSDGVTGMQSMYVFHFMQLLCRAAGQDDILAFRNSVCLSADVTAAYDPSWASAFEKQNGTYAGRGIAIFKYTGSRGKSSASDANAELVGDITRMLDANNVAWQIGEMGRLDLGGGGTIAKYVANRGIKVLDMGVPVLSMHSPFEVIHKTDLYMAYRTFALFCQNAD